ncbi:MAG: hypothetical protein ACJ76F_08440 [Bacteroidia bacterium]
MIQKAYKLFITGGIVLALISIIIKLLKPDSVFDVRVLDLPIRTSWSFLWFAFSIYLFILAGVYLGVERLKLRTRKWLLISHCVCVGLFIVLAAILNSLDFAGFHTFLERLHVSLITLLSIYAFLLLADVILFLAGIMALVINLYTFSKK